jgi:hypothetical protein
MTCMSGNRARDIQPQRGRGRHEDECDFIRWCFSDPDIVAAFDAEFGGTVMRGQSSADDARGVPPRDT